MASTPNPIEIWVLPLCKALHKGNYRKILFMERNKLKSRLLGRFMFISFHNSPQWMMFKNII